MHADRTVKHFTAETLQSAVLFSFKQSDNPEDETLWKKHFNVASAAEVPPPIDPASIPEGTLFIVSVKSKKADLNFADPLPVARGVITRIKQ